MQQDLAPISGSSAAVPTTTAQLHHISFNSPPYYSPSENSNLNSNYNHVQSYSSNGVNSLVQIPSLHPISDLNVNPNGNAASNQVDISHSYLPAAATVAQEPDAFYQQYAKIPLRNTNQITGLQKHHQWKNRPPRTNSIIQTKQITGLQKHRLLENRPPRKIKVVHSIRCEVCKVDCNSESVRDLHYLGNKHKKNLQKLDIANSSNPLDWCEVCKVEFTSKIVLDQHNQGRRHKKNLEKLDVANSNVPLAWCEVCQTNYNNKIVLDQHNLGKRHKKNLEKLDVANSNVPLAFWCEVCQTNYNSKIVLDQHKLGKKHKNREQLTSANSSALSVLSAPGLVCVPAIGPGENPVEATSTPDEQRPQKKEVGLDDLEAKKRKMLQGGAAPEAVCMCSVCNVICNSIAVFKYHLAGKKHSAMMKKYASAISSAAAT